MGGRGARTWTIFHDFSQATIRDLRHELEANGVSDIAGNSLTYCATMLVFEVRPGKLQPIEIVGITDSLCLLIKLIYINHHLLLASNDAL